MKTDKEKQIVFISRFKSINDLNKWLDDNKDNASFYKTIYNENDHLLYLYCKVNDPFDEDDIKEQSCFTCYHCFECLGDLLCNKIKTSQGFNALIGPNYDIKDNGKSCIYFQLDA